MRRRQFLHQAGAAAAVAAPLAAAFAQAPGPMGDKPAIKITDIKTFLVGTAGGREGGEPEQNEDGTYSIASIGTRNWLYVKVETDQGINGIGEAYSVGPDEATVKVIEDFKYWLVGQDPRNIQYLFDLMYNTTRFPGGAVVNAAISGIEHALWDVAGKAAGLPVWALLGGRVRDKIRAYQSIGGGTPRQAGENAKELIGRFGYTAVKMQPSASDYQTAPYNDVTRTAGERVGAVREAVGPDVDIAVDIHAKFFEVQRAIRIAHEIEPHRPFWLEEPVRPENFDVMKKLADHVNIPLASGECNYMKYEFKPLIDSQALDIVQPDICVCGGMLEMKKIAAMAEAQYMMVAPHNPMSPLATAINVHFAASTPNFLILEYRAPVSGAAKEVLRVPPRRWRRNPSFREDGSVGFI